MVAPVSSSGHSTQMSSDDCIDAPFNVLGTVVPCIIEDHWHDDRKRALKRARREVEERKACAYLDDIDLECDLDIFGLQYDTELAKADMAMMARMIKSLTEVVADLRAQVAELQRKQ